MKEIIDEFIKNGYLLNPELVKTLQNIDYKFFLQQINKEKHKPIILNEDILKALQEKVLPILKLSPLCLCLLLSACQKQDEATSPTSSTAKIELIAEDLVQFQEGPSIQRTAFTGTIRAVNQSSIQAQVTATATAVSAQVGQAVQKGQVLVRLNNQDNAARLAQAQANLASTFPHTPAARKLLLHFFSSAVLFHQKK